jgi:thioredoxin-related protein
MKRNFSLMLLLPVLALLVSAGTLLHAAEAVPPQAFTWRAATLDEVLKEAKEANKPVMLCVYATWCPYCKRQEAEIWNAPEAATTFKNLIPIRVDFDKPEGQAVKKQFNILSLPSILFLKSTGEEVDRIAGYDDKQKFLKEAALLMKGVDPLPGMQKKLAASPKDTPLLLQVGTRLLHRGNLAEAKTLFEKIQQVDPKNTKGQTAETYFILGRYYSRVVDDAASALPYWKQLVEKFPQSDNALGGFSWALNAFNKLNQFDEGFTWGSQIVNAQQGKTSGNFAYILASQCAKKDVHLEESLTLLEKAKTSDIGADEVTALETTLKDLIQKKTNVTENKGNKG